MATEYLAVSNPLVLHEESKKLNAIMTITKNPIPKPTKPPQVLISAILFLFQKIEITKSWSKVFDSDKSRI